MKQTLFLTVAVMLLVSYDLVSATWTNPTEAPTGGNVPAPLNIGGDRQTKSGQLTAVDGVQGGNVSVGGCPHGSCGWDYETFQLPDGNNFRFNVGSAEVASLYNDGRMNLGYLDLRPQDSGVEGGEIRLQGANTSVSQHIDNHNGNIRFHNNGRTPYTFYGWNNAPTIRMMDSDHRDWWAHVNGDSFYFIADRNNSGGWGEDSPWPLQLYAGSSGGEDAAVFSNQVRANSYCDRNGANCISFDGCSEGDVMTYRSGNIVCDNATPPAPTTYEWRVDHQHVGRTNTTYLTTTDTNLYLNVMRSCSSLSAPSNITAAYWVSGYLDDGQRSGITIGPSDGSQYHRSLSGLSVGQTVTLSTTRGGCSGGPVRATATRTR